MRDTYGRTIDYMRISITDRCNLRCQYCMPNGICLIPMENLLTYEEIETVCEAAAELGISKLKITGGEPLVRLGCAELIGKLKKIPGINQVTMTTNGVILGKYLPQLIKNGLDAVNISLDTLKPEVYKKITGKMELKTVLKNIEYAVSTGIPVKINAVLQTGINDSEWLDLAKLSEKLPVDVRYIEMMPVGYGKKYESVSNKDLLISFKSVYPNIEIEKEEKIHGNGPAVYYHIPGAKGSIGFISAIHGKFCKNCNRLRLSSQGKLKPCLCFGDEIDLRKALRKEDKAQSKELLQELFLKAVQIKPKEHEFETDSSITEIRQMVQIGG